MSSTPLQTLSRNRNFSIRLVVMMRAQLAFLSPFLLQSTKDAFLRWLDVMEAEIRDYTPKDHL